MIFKKHYPLVVSVAFFGLLVSLIVFNILRTNQGNFTYPLDDTFIHMSIARNLANHHVWGLTQYEFNSSSSSLLYTLLLGLIYKLYAPNIFIPLILNVIFASAVIYVCYKYLKDNYVGLFKILIILISIILFSPLPIVVMEGMEHTLHIMLSVIFLYNASVFLSMHKSLENKENKQNGRFVGLLVTAFLLPFTRYEGLFIIFVVCCLLLIQKRWKYSFLIGFVSLLSLITYGFISIQKGSMWAPNSIVLKGSSMELSLKGIIYFLSKPFLVFYDAPWLFNLTVAVLVVYAIRYKFHKFFWEQGQLLITISICALWLHLEFAGIGWVFRYESYLVALLIFTLGLVAFRNNSMPDIIGKADSLVYIACMSLLIITLGFKVASRGLKSLNVALYAPKNIYEQQYQMGLFLKEYYQGKAVALNDVGAVCYLSNNIKLIDMAGLGSVEIAKAIRKNNFSSSFLDQLLKRKEVKIAVIYEKFYRSYTLRWKKIAEWQISDNLVCGDDVVTFYAVNAEENLPLGTYLKEFEKKLPKTIKVRYFN